MKNRIALLVASVTGIGTLYLVAREDNNQKASQEARFLSNTRQLTFAGKRSGEGYFSQDGSSQKDDLSKNYHFGIAPKNFKGSQTY